MSPTYASAQTTPAQAAPAQSQAPANLARVNLNRVVAVGGSITEIVYALDLQSRLVGVDATSLYPPQALKDVQSVGYMRALSAEGVLSLKPTAVLALDGSGPPAALKLVADAGAPVITVHDDPSPAGVSAKIEAVGRLFGAEDAAAQLATQTSARFASVDAMRRAILKQGADKQASVKPVRVLFVLSLQNGRPIVGGRGTAADAMIHLAGGVNAAGDIDGYKPMTDEAVIEAAPDVVLKMDNGTMVGSADQVFALPAFSATPAAATRALIGMDGLYLLGFGPRAPDAARDLMAALYPDLKLPPLAKIATRP